MFEPGTPRPPSCRSAQAHLFSLCPTFVSNSYGKTPASGRRRRRDLAVRLRSGEAAAGPLRAGGRNRTFPFGSRRRTPARAGAVLRAGLVHGLGGEGKRVPAGGARFTRIAAPPNLRAAARVPHLSLEGGGDRGFRWLGQGG